MTKLKFHVECSRPYLFKLDSNGVVYPYFTCLGSFCRYRVRVHVQPKKQCNQTINASRKTLLFGSFVMTVPTGRPYFYFPDRKAMHKPSSIYWTKEPLLINRTRMGEQVK